MRRILSSANFASSAAFVAIGAIASLTTSCDRRGLQDSDVRPAWVHARAAAHNWYVREALNGTPDVEYGDGWYPPETDRATGGGWRWQNKRSTTRLRTHVQGRPETTDMVATVYGWTAWQHVGIRTSDLEFSVNGHVIENFRPPHETFSHEIFVPKYLLGNGEWVDLVINASNTGRPRDDWRDLGFCTTGILWKPAGAT